MTGAAKLQKLDLCHKTAALGNSSASFTSAFSDPNDRACGFGSASDDTSHGLNVVTSGSYVGFLHHRHMGVTRRILGFVSWHPPFASGKYGGDGVGGFGEDLEEFLAREWRVSLLWMGQ